MRYYEIINKNIILADKAKYFDNFFFKAKGLMFTRPLRRGHGLILVAPNEGILETTIHMLFVFYPVDIIWLNSEKIVVDIKQKVLPFIPWIIPKEPAKYVVELPINTAKHIRIGDKLDFTEV